VRPAGPDPGIGQVSAPSLNEQDFRARAAGSNAHFDLSDHFRRATFAEFASVLIGCQVDSSMDDEQVARKP
jgi:hypothetical protein